MKNTFTIVFILFIVMVSAQNELSFDKRFVQSEDHWVAFPADSLGKHSYGFIYIDSQAGLTLQHEGSFTIDAAGKFIPEAKQKETSIKVRLQPNNVVVAFVPESKYKELDIEKIPEWLQYYKTDENSVARLYRWGYMYNGWGECEKALEYLEKAKNIDLEYKGIRVELAYSYNCLKRYKEAVDVLKQALKTTPKDAYINKELLYAQVKMGLLQDAEKTYKRVVKECPDQTYTAENAYNILQAYYSKNEVKKFNSWLSQTKVVLTKDDRFNPAVQQMIQKLK